MGSENWQNRSGMKRQYGRSNSNNNNRDRRSGGGSSSGSSSGGVPSNRNQALDSNGPMGRIRGNAYQICERYLSQARDAASSGDRIMAENLYQHAEHYLRLNNMFNEPRDDNRKPRNENAPESSGRDETPPEGRTPSGNAASPLPGTEEQPSILDAPPPGAADLFGQAETSSEKPEGTARPKRGHWRRKPKDAEAGGEVSPPAPEAESKGND